MALTKPLLSIVTLMAATGVAVSLTTTGCVDASGLQTCLNTAASAAKACVANAEANGSEIELEACGCELYIGNFNCYSSHCWNRVYECEYQEYVVEYFSLCLIAKLPVPYFPAPDGAPNSCSCNLGNVFEAFNGSVAQGNTCLVSQSGLGSLDKIEGCKCCELSGAISSVYSLCPETDPSLLGTSSFANLETILDTKYSSCDSYLSEFNCIEDLGFSSIASSGSYYAPTNLPTNGTATLSNIAGTVTAPPSGSVFAYTQGGDSQVYTITAASANGAAGTTPAGSVSGFGTTSAAGSAAPTSKNAAKSLRVGSSLLATSAMFVCWQLW